MQHHIIRSNEHIYLDLFEGGGNGDGAVFDELQDLIRTLISSKTTRRDNGDYGVPKFDGLGSPGGGSSSK